MIKRNKSKIYNNHQKLSIILCSVVLSLALLLTYEQLKCITSESGQESPFFSVKQENATNEASKASVQKDYLTAKMSENDSHEDSVSNTRKEVRVIGDQIGIYVKTKGVIISKVGSVEIEGGELCPCEGKLSSGDYILAINGKEIHDKNELVETVNLYGTSPMLLKISREGQISYVLVEAVQGLYGRYLLGLWVKDDVSGIGTLTCMDDEHFYALGHSISEQDSGELFSVSDGAIFPAKILNIKKPEPDSTGRLEGTINYQNQDILGRVRENTEYGIFGDLSELGCEKYKECIVLPLAEEQEVVKGPVKLLIWISGKPDYYDGEITEIRFADKNERKRGFTIKITDERLLSMTGGIVQGFSGTPVIQDNRLIGAVTHVFVDDATGGYGIFIQDMMQ